MTPSYRGSSLARGEHDDIWKAHTPCTHGADSGASRARICCAHKRHGCTCCAHSPSDAQIPSSRSTPSQACAHGGHSGPDAGGAQACARNDRDDARGQACTPCERTEHRHSAYARASCGGTHASCDHVPRCAAFRSEWQSTPRWPGRAWLQRASSGDRSPRHACDPHEYACGCDREHASSHDRTGASC